MLRCFPRFQVAAVCFPCSPPDLNYQHYFPHFKEHRLKGKWILNYMFTVNGNSKLHGTYFKLLMSQPKRFLFFLSFYLPSFLSFFFGQLRIFQQCCASPPSTSSGSGSDPHYTPALLCQASISRLNSLTLGGSTSWNFSAEATGNAGALGKRKHDKR
jgi:hypothetical protein